LAQVDQAVASPLESPASEHGEVAEDLVRDGIATLDEIVEGNAGLRRCFNERVQIDDDEIDEIGSLSQSAEALRKAKQMAMYPPEGIRGIGGERATMFGLKLAEHTALANDHVLLVPIIETVATVAAIPAMCEVDGIDMFYFGPADFSSTAGFRGQWEGPGVAEQILAAKDELRKRGKQCGVIATSPENLLQRRDQGFRMIGLGSDVNLLARTLRDLLAKGK